MTDHISTHEILTLLAVSFGPGLLLAGVAQGWIARHAGWGLWRTAALLLGALIVELVLSIAVWITPALHFVFLYIPPPEFLPSVMQIAFPGLVANLVSVVSTTVVVWLVWRRRALGVSALAS